MGPHAKTNRQRAVEIARVLKLEIAGITDFDQSARREMLDLLDDLIAALQEG
jgi:hypothetical protein